MEWLSFRLDSRNGFSSSPRMRKFGLLVRVGMARHAPRREREISCELVYRWLMRQTMTLKLRKALCGALIWDFLMKSENLQLYKSTFIKTGKTFIQKSHKTPKRKLENFPPSLVAISVSLLRIFLTAPISRSRIDYCLDAGELSARSSRHARRSFDSYISWRESTLRMGKSGYAKSSARPLAETSHKSSSRIFRCRPRRHTNRDINTIYHSHTFCTTEPHASKSMWHTLQARSSMKICVGHGSQIFRHSKAIMSSVMRYFFFATGTSCEIIAMMLILQ